MILTIACPAPLLDDANALAASLAFGLSDLRTFGALNWQDSKGNLYAAASFEASPKWIASAQTAFQRPAWDTKSQVNLTGANRAQAALILWMGKGPIPQVAPGVLTVIGGMIGLDAVAAMGLEQAEGDMPHADRHL